jgi:hypothetical protein
MSAGRWVDVSYEMMVMTSGEHAQTSEVYINRCLLFYGKIAPFRKYHALQAREVELHVF